MTDDERHALRESLERSYPYGPVTCAVCGEPIERGDRRFAIRGTALHVHCAVYRRGQADDERRTAGRKAVQPPQQRVACGFGAHRWRCPLVTRGQPRRSKGTEASAMGNACA